MMKNKTWTRTLLGAGLALALLAPASAQQVTQPVRNGDSQKPVVSTYTNGQADPQEPAPATSTKGDSEKPVVKTYESGIPEAQSNNPGPRANDVSGVDDSQKPVVQTYDKQPNSSGDEQKLDLIRYQEQNDANDGEESQLEMKVLKGSVEE